MDDNELIPPDINLFVPEVFPEIPVPVAVVIPPDILIANNVPYNSSTVYVVDKKLGSKYYIVLISTGLVGTGTVKIRVTQYFKNNIIVAAADLITVTVAIPNGASISMIDPTDKIHISIVAATITAGTLKIYVVEFD